MSEKLVSVIINSYNGADFLSKSIYSVLNQTYKNLEIIFWDNASNDNSKKILETINDPRLKVYYSKTFEKLYSAKNKAVKLSNGDYLAFLDVDDWWEKNKLKFQIQDMINKNCDLSCTNYWIVNERKKTRYSAFKKEIISKNYFDYAIKKYFIGMSTLIIKKNVYDSLDYGFDSSFEIIGDYDLVLRIIKKYQLCYLHKKLSYYRWHSNNLSNKKFRLNILELIAWKKKMLKNKFFLNNLNYTYLKDNILFLISLYYKNKNNYKKILFFLSKTRSKKFLLKIFILLIIPKKLLSIFRS